MSVVHHNAMYLVEQARRELSSEKSSIQSRNRNRSMVEMATNPMRRTPRTDMRSEQDLDEGARRIFEKFIVSLVQAESRTEGVVALVAGALGIQSISAAGRSASVTLINGDRLPLTRWMDLTGRSYRGMGDRKVSADLVRVEHAIRQDASKVVAGDLEEEPAAFTP